MPFVAQGDATQLGETYVLVRATPAGPLIDPDDGTLTLLINDPDGDPVLSLIQSQITRVSLGRFAYTWQTDDDQALGPYAFVWNGEINGDSLPSAVDEVEVIPAGTLTTGVLTIEEFRAFVTTDLEDVPLQLLLDVAAVDIVRIIGPVGVRTEIHDGYRSSIINLDQQADSVGIVTESVGDTETTLDPDDYLLRNDGRVLERIDTGTNPPSDWRRGRPSAWAPWQGRVTVEYTPLDDVARRKDVQRQLVELALGASAGAAAGAAGVTSERIGEFSETFGSSSSTGGSQGYQQSRQALLDSLVSVGWSFS